MVLLSNQRMDCKMRETDKERAEFDEWGGHDDGI